MNSPAPSRQNVYRYLACFIILTAFLYCSIRAYLLSITHDEALTYLIHTSGSFYEIFFHSLPMSSNNHLLNTVLIKILVNIFGLSAFVIRIPALIGCGLFLWGTFKILQLFLKEHLLLIGLCLLTFNPFMLDFFSLARGYSLAMGFLAFGIYFALKAVSQYDSKDYIKNMAITSIMLSLSVLSNLVFVIFYLSTMSIFTLMGLKHLTGLIKQKQPGNLIRKQFFKIIFLPIIPGALFLLTVYTLPALNLTRKKELYFGGTSGFWEDTVTSLITATLYGKNYFNGNIIFAAKLLIVTTLAGTILIILYKLIKRSALKIEDNYLFFITASLLLCSTIIILMHALFDVKYVIERTALFFVPLWMILLLILWAQARRIQKEIARRALNSLFCFLTIIMAFHFFNTANITHYHIWKYDASTKEMMDHIIELNEGNALYSNSIRIGADWLFEPGINFYRAQHKLGWLAQTTRVSPDDNFDYYYLFINPANKELIERRNLKVIKKFDITQTFLAVP
jgi:hypothetical protein